LRISDCGFRIEKLNALQRRIDLIRNPKLKTASLLDCGFRIEKPNIFNHALI